MVGDLLKSSLLEELQQIEEIAPPNQHHEEACNLQLAL